MARVAVATLFEHSTPPRGAVELAVHDAVCDAADRGSTSIPSPVEEDGSANTTVMRCTDQARPEPAVNGDRTSCDAAERGEDPVVGTSAIRSRRMMLRRPDCFPGPRRQSVRGHGRISGPHHSSRPSVTSGAGRLERGSDVHLPHAGAT